MLYHYIDKYPSLSLQGIGLLSLLLEPKVTFHFKSRESFLSYFKLSSQYLSEKYWSELLELGIIYREQVQKNQVYQVKGTKIKFEVPLTFSENKTISILFDEQIQLIHKAFKTRVKLLFKNFSFEDMAKEDVYRFFNLFTDMLPNHYTEFLKIIEKKQVYSIQYLEAVANRIVKQKVKTTYSKSLHWGDKKQQSMEDDFAIKVATGEALTRTKYILLLQKNDIETLKKYYQRGKELLPESYNFYMYDWLS